MTHNVHYCLGICRGLSLVLVKNEILNDTLKNKSCSFRAKKKEKKDNETLDNND